MKESLRRAVLFTVIVITGSVMILFDVPLIILIPLILVTGFIVLVLLGAITRSEIRSAFRRPQFKNLKKIGILKRLDEMKFFEKKPQQPDKKPAPVQKKQEPELSQCQKNRQRLPPPFIPLLARFAGNRSQRAQKTEEKGGAYQRAAR